MDTRSKDPIRRVREERAFEDKLGTLFNDVVEGADGKNERLLRWRWDLPGVVIVPIHEQHGERCIGFCRVYRYAVDGMGLELPRGSMEKGESVEAAAKRELEEETGCCAERVRIIGELHPDSGILELPVKVAVAKIERIVSETEHQGSHEGIFEICWVAERDLREKIRSGELKCGISLAALQVLQAAGV
jgi:8-oxo-dGTP pyrophosphatase MutT (NUDIX family)